jgi:hypothetical protein
MPLQVSDVHLQHEFCHSFDNELEGAKISLTAIHRVLDKVGAPEANGAESTSATQRLWR